MDRLTRTTINHRGLVWMCLLAVVVSVWIPWWCARVAFPEEPISVTLLYRSRYGDAEYFPLITQLSKLSFTDNSVKEHEGTTIRSFPNLTMSVHAIGFAMFGTWGYPVADLVYSFVYLLLAYSLFRTFEIRPLPSLLAALFLTLRIPEVLANFHVPGPWEVWRNLWRPRLPRPFVAEILLLFGLFCTIRLFKTDQPKGNHWLLLGFSYGLPLYGDLHGTIILALCSPVLLLKLRHMPFGKFAKGTFVSLIPFSILAIPFMLSRLNEHPDIPVRWGVYSIDRFAPPIIREDLPWFAAALVLCTLLLFAIRLFQADWETRSWEYHGFELRSLGYISTFILIGFWSATLSSIVLGKTIQIYQFSTRSRTVFAYLLYLLCVMVLDVCITKIAKKGMIKRFFASRFAPIGFVILLMGLLVIHAPTRSTLCVKERHCKGVFNGLDGLGQSYRRSLAEIAKYLDTNVQEDAVLACFDQGLFSWWLTNKPGYWFLAEPFVSYLPDDEVEKRVALICKLIEMPADEYIEFIKQRCINNYWLGMGKYQATVGHTYRPLNDYLPEEQKKIKQSSLRDPWVLVIPQSEQRRLQEEFQNTSLGEFKNRQLDVLVLTNDLHQKFFSPPQSSWKLTFENGVFRVFERR